MPALQTPPTSTLALLPGRYNGIRKSSAHGRYNTLRSLRMTDSAMISAWLTSEPFMYLRETIRHMVACLLDFVLCHNLRVGHFNSTGHKYIGHDSIWLLNEIQELEITIGERYNCLPAQLAWVNGNLYTKSEQTAGIIHIPKSVCELCGTSISLGAADIWNQKAETNVDIYYKLEEQLTAYLNGSYKDSANIRQSCAHARGQTDPLRLELENPQRTNKIVNTTSGSVVPHRVTTGFEPLGNSATGRCLQHKLLPFAK
ncbi:hypothetical protein GGX14DRAFT_610700 [Mycena pura]|uniref:Uncharacterized protein n=1 Tax=Mycena pura TaxID=153505 RepID=A0AAD6VMV2_9AGAR|nr:hypothetical protein GGX14DRAFT_610700 [Mycena pura]